MATSTAHQKNSRAEGELARQIESQTAKLPSDTFLWGAVGAMGLAAMMQLCGRRHTSLFFGQWVAPILLFGVYNKLVKIGGHDQSDDRWPDDQ